jgi:phenylacetate-CoA ligase
LPYWRELEKTQYYPYDFLIELQWSRLKDLLNFVYHHNVFYRKRFDAAGLQPGDIQSSEDLRLLPLLTKEEIRKHTLPMISDLYSAEDLMKFKTGGSTGKSLEIYITEECSELRNACARRHDCWTGWRPGEPIGAVWGNPVIPGDMKTRLKNWLLWPMIYLDTMNVTYETVFAFASQWEKSRPTLLYGHAHSIYVLAEIVRKLDIDTIRPRGILSTSMMLMPHERRSIEEVFGVPVTDRYGCEEVSLIASECERHEGMHLNIEHLFIEFIKEDGREALPGEHGSIVVTDLMNRAMPFIRYRVEDIGVPSKRTCSCGRGLPLMDMVVGRSADFLVRRDGSRVAGVSLIENTLTKIPGIDQMQIIQESRDFIVLNIVAGRDYTSATHDHLIAYFKQEFSGVHVDVRLMERIMPEASGKYRFSINKTKTI